MSFPPDFLGCMRHYLFGFGRKRTSIPFLNGTVARTLISRLSRISRQTASTGLPWFTNVYTATFACRWRSGPPEAMLQSLLNWSSFDPNYFDNLRKLDRKEAERNLDHLKQLQELRDGKIREERRRRESAEAEMQKAKRTLEQVREDYLALHSGSLKPQRAAMHWKRSCPSLPNCPSWRLPNLSAWWASKWMGQ